MIAMLITKRTEIVMGIQVCLISWINFDYKEMVERKAFLANPKRQYHVSQWGEHDCSGDYNEYQSLSHFTNQL